MTKTARQRDFLDEIVDERSERNREFPELVEAALRRRKNTLGARTATRAAADREGTAGDQLGQTSVTRDVTDV
jgi:hypothetical protein